MLRVTGLILGITFIFQATVQETEARLRPKAEENTSSEATDQGRPPLPPGFMRLDKNGDGVIDIEEAPEWLRRRFMRFDGNRDGVIDGREYHRATAGERPENEEQGPAEEAGEGEEMTPPGEETEHECPRRGSGITPVI